jgi:hypothetical protein
METTVIKLFLDQKILLFYCRDVDDCVLLVRKRYKDFILEIMNAFDPFLKFSVVEMQNNQLIYLDTK